MPQAVVRGCYGSITAKSLQVEATGIERAISLVADQAVSGSPNSSFRVQTGASPRGVLTPSHRCLARLVAKCYHHDMSQPVKISDELILDARLTAEIAERSIAGQIEFWAQLGRAIEPWLEGSRALALRRAGAAVPLSECLASVDSAAGRGASWNTSSRGRFPTISRLRRLRR